MKYAFYDFSTSPYSYDFLSFLACARGHGCEHVVFVPGNRVVYEKGVPRIFNKCSPEESARRLGNLLAPLAGDCTVLSNRESVYQFDRTDCFPIGYDPDNPKPHHVLGDVLRFPNPKWLDVDPHLKRVALKDYGNPVTITIRESSIKPARNSNIKEWEKVAQWLKGRGMNPVLVPDTEHPERDFGILKCEQALKDVRYRHALYSNALLNLASNGGPIMLCVYSRFPFLLFKPIVDGFWETSPEYWNGVCGVGNQLPWFSNQQRIVWEEDTFDVIAHHIEKWALREAA